MFDVKIRMEDSTGMIARIKAGTEQWPQVLVDSVDWGLEWIRNTAMDKLRGQVLNVKSGRLWRSLGKKLTVTARNIDGRVGTRVIYARVHEFGAIIKPKNAQFLVFTYKGRTYRARQVVIPKRPYMKPTMKEARRPVLGHIKEELMKLLGD